MFEEVMAEWRRLNGLPPARDCRCRDQSSWNRLLPDNEQTRRWRVHEWLAGEIAFPLYLHQKYHEYTAAALTDQLSGATPEKLRFTFGLWFETFVFEESCLFFHFMEVCEEGNSRKI